MHRIRIPIPFPVKYTNCYLIPESKLLIDPGPKTPESHRELISGLESAGFRLSDLDGIILTHGHLDHFGLAAQISEISGAKVYVHPLDSRAISDPGSYSQLMAQTAQMLLLEGFSPKIAAMLRSQAVLDYFRSLLDPVPDPKPIPNSWDDFQIIHTPGHSPGHICLYDPQAKQLICGDHLLSGITPITFPSYRLFGAGLRSYLESLDALRELEVKMVYPGHRRPFQDLRSRIAQIQQHHRERIRAILEILRESPKLAGQISKQLFGRIPGDQVMLAASETLSHLELLLDEGQIQLLELQGNRYYKLVDQ